MLNVTLTLMSYTAIIVSLVYLIVYSKMYSWWRHPLGLVMNLSVVVVALIASGTATRLLDNDLGSIIAAASWLAYAGLLIWRLRLLTEYARKRRAEEVPVESSDHHPPSAH